METSSNCQNLDLSIVLPCKNEGNNIKKVIEQINSNLENLNIRKEFIIIDDGSNDNTWNEIINLKKIYGDSLHGISFYKNFGKETAIRFGLETANGQAIVIMDADLEHPPTILNEMYNHYLNGEKIVTAIKKDPNRKSLFKNLGAFIVYKFIKLFSKIDLQNSSDFILLSHDAKQLLLAFQERNSLFRGQVHLLGIQPKIIYFDIVKNTNKKSNFNLIKLFILGIDAITSFTAFPLQIMFFLGLSIIFASSILIFHTLIKYFLGKSLEGFTTMITIQLFIGGFIILGLGIIGEYIAKIYDEIKNRPKYFIKEKI